MRYNLAMNWNALVRKAPSLKRRWFQSQIDAAMRWLGEGPGFALTVSQIHTKHGAVLVRRVNLLGRAGNFDGATVEEALYMACVAVIG